MIGFLRNWITGIATLVIIIVMLEILVPSGKFRKFIGLVSGFILMLAVINPFIGLFKKGIDMEELHFAGSSFISRREIEASSNILKEGQMKKITEVYKGKLSNQIEESLGKIKGISGVKAVVEIEENYKSQHYGEIKKVYVSISQDQAVADAKPAVKIDKVDIKGSTAAKAEKSEVSEAMKILIHEKVKGLMGVDKEFVLITRDR